ncbi:MAG: ABC transporter permease [Lachnospiraceae bacterium]|nr:ABC transporter permease [Lachnospiraceae bacterium]
MKKRRMYLRMVMASLMRRRSRMVIALLAIAIGATILSGLVTIYVDVPRQMGAQFRSYGANMLFVAAGESMTREEVQEGIAKIRADELVGAAPYHYETVRIHDRPVLAAATDMKEAKATSPFWRVDGEWVAQNGEIMIGKNVADTYRLKVGDALEATFAPEEADEDDLDRSVNFVVTGVLDTGGKEEDYVYMTFDDLEELIGKPFGFDVCELSIQATADKLSAYADEITESVEGVQARLVKRVTESETTVLGKLQALVLLVTVIVLALTMICVATTMTAVVAERRREIGLRKALGASNGSIVAEFMGEGVALGAAGGICGALLGFLFAQAVSINVFNSSIAPKPLLLPLTMLVSVLVTGASCLIPIRSATEVDPALVLKGE